MSRTDRTRPWQVVRDDPLNNRFKMVGNLADPMFGLDEWHWKRIKTHNCWCCSSKKYWKKTKRSARNRWLKNRQAILATVDKSDIDILPEKFRE